MKTPWYPGTIKPVRVGWYEVELLENDIHLDWWDGKRWKSDPTAYPYYKREQDNYPWRGLTAASGSDTGRNVPR